MQYNKHNFKSKQVLTSQMMNEIDQGIADLVEHANAIVLTPAGANMRKEFKMEFTGDSITASTSGMVLIVRGKSPGSATITVTHISGAVYTCTINVT